ncbi:MAG TPA: radical SAM protein, partial [Phycisphaerae bacterium]|nr:radical SAM protein [Phycisphaerae bacterium]
MQTEIKELGEFRDTMRRFVGSYRELPVSTRATCPKCHRVVPAEFRRHKSQVVLAFNCPHCGEQPPIVHDDAIWTNRASDLPGSATETFSGCRIRPVSRRLPRTVETLCPECGAIIPGRYFVQDSAVWIEKTCPDHGYFRDRINSDVKLFAKASWWSFEEHAGLEFPHVTDGKNCPSDCGLCNQHLSGPCLAQIDLTNRCNMKCPICFANANAQGYIWEPDYNEIVRELKVLRAMKPHPTTAIQFTGGEPTIHPDFLKIISAARDMGFSYIQIATNGITLSDENFARQCRDAGLHTLYLQFDGVGDEAYKETRNYPGIWSKKLAAIENARKVGMKVCLVPTIVKNINDEQVPKILDFAFRNVDVISGISWQPVSFTGRMSVEELQTHRYTLGDLAHDMAKCSNVVPMRDIMPLSIVVPLSNMLEAITDNPKVRPSCHPDCAMGTYFIVSPSGQAWPFPAVLDVEGLFAGMNVLANKIKAAGRTANFFDKLRIVWLFMKNWRWKTAPKDIKISLLMRSIMGMVDKRIGRGKGSEKNYRTLLSAGMHFQ